MRSSTAATYPSMLLAMVRRTIATAGYNERNRQGTHAGGQILLPHSRHHVGIALGVSKACVFTIKSCIQQRQMASASCGCVAFKDWPQALLLRDSQVPPC